VLDADDTSASHIWGQFNSWLPQTGTASVVPTGVPFEHVTLQNPKDPHLKGARWLLEGGGKDLTDDERALLLAMIAVDAENLNEEYLAAVDKLKAQVKDYDTNELVQAVAAHLPAQEDHRAPRQPPMALCPRLAQSRAVNGLGQQFSF
jgi:hypothetical protein